MARRKKEVEEKPKEPIDVKNFKITDLEGIGPVSAKRFAAAGIETPFDIIVRGSQEISQILDIKNEDAAKLVSGVFAQMIQTGLIDDVSSPGKLSTYRDKALFFDTGSKKLNEILLGGFESQGITELFGEDGGGKTQTCYTTIAIALHNGIPIRMIDCEGTFYPKRLMEIAKERGFVKDEKDLSFMDKLEYVLALDTDRILDAVNQSVKSIMERGIRLILIDGMVGKYRLEYDQGRGELNQRQNDLKAPVKHLENMAEYLNCCILITNQVMGNPDSFMGEKFKAIGGYIVGHNSKYRVKFTKGIGNKRIVRVIKSNKHSPQDAEVYLTKAGVWDAKDFEQKDDELPTEHEMVDTSLLQT